MKSMFWKFQATKKKLALLPFGLMGFAISINLHLHLIMEKNFKKANEVEIVTSQLLIGNDVDIPFPSTEDLSLVD